MVARSSPRPCRYALPRRPPGRRAGRRTSGRRPDWQRRWSGRPRAGLLLSAGRAGRTARPALQRGHELEAFDGHGEVDRVAVLAAAEAVIEALVGNDVEGGRLLVVERAAAPQIAAAAAQSDMASDHLGNRQSCLELLERNGGSVSHAASAVPLAVGLRLALRTRGQSRGGDAINPNADRSSAGPWRNPCARDSDS